MKRTIAALLLATPAAAEEQLWTSFSANGPVAEGSRLLLFLDAQARFGTNDVTVFRPGLGWRVSPKLDLFAGYTRQTTHRPGPDVREDRSWQQASIQLGQAFGARINSRTRLEQRHREGDTGWRLRQQLRAAWPVQGTPVSVVVSDEFFLAFDDTRWGQRAGMDQNRAFIGASVQLSRPLRLEGGYLHQTVSVRGAPDRSNSILSVTLSAAL